MKYLVKIKNILVGILTVVIFTLLPITVFTLITSKSEALFMMRSFVVLSGSMQPLIPTGAVVYTRKQDNYLPNDIISFETAGKTVTHRIINVTKKDNLTYYQTRGDANNVADSELTPDNKVLGRAQFHLPFLGILIIFLKTLTGFITLIVLPTISFVGFELHNIKKEIEKQAEKKLLERMSI